MSTGRHRACGVIFAAAQHWNDCSTPHQSQTLDIHQTYTTTNGLIRDDAQKRIVGQLANLQRSLVKSHADRGGILQRLGLKESPGIVRGLYLWGDVGRGKTFLMDLFFATLTIPGKKRIHFHRMMSEVHERLNAAAGEEDPLDVVAAAISGEIRVLCFDEFFVSDIGDAMILGRLLDGLFSRGVTLITTSNSPPAELYRDGLQRDRFLPAIKLLEKYTQIIELDAGTDYRLRLLQLEGTYFCSLDEDSEQRLLHCFQQIASGQIEENTAIDVLGRSIRTLGAAEGVVWFDFSELCEGPRSQNDYIEIARTYQTVMISKIPALTSEHDDATRRFIALVDEFYDRHVKLILSSVAAVDSLYQGKRLKFEFERTRSRLIEMQSEKYLHLAHLS